jgi:hypothetical protein
MDQKTFSIVAGVIFAAVALFHLVRIYMDWPVMNRVRMPDPKSDFYTPIGGATRGE